MSVTSSAVQMLLALAGDPRTGALIALLAVAAVIDWRTLRIPNWLTGGGLAFGLIYNTFAAGAWQDGLSGAAAGMAVGMAVFLPVYVLRVLGAGDVKLMGMVGAFVGFPDILQAVLYSLVVGGFAAVGVALYRRAFGRMTANVVDIVQSMALAVVGGLRPTPALAGRASIGMLPYGVSIAVGTTTWLAARVLGLA